VYYFPKKKSTHTYTVCRDDMHTWVELNVTQLRNHIRY